MSFFVFVLLFAKFHVEKNLIYALKVPVSLNKVSSTDMSQHSSLSHRLIFVYCFCCSKSKDRYVWFFSFFARKSMALAVPETRGIMPPVCGWFSLITYSSDFVGIFDCLLVVFYGGYYCWTDYFVSETFDFADLLGVSVTDYLLEFN